MLTQSEILTLNDIIILDDFLKIGQVRNRSDSGFLDKRPRISDFAIFPIEMIAEIKRTAESVLIFYRIAGFIEFRKEFNRNQEGPA